MPWGQNEVIAQVAIYLTGILACNKYTSILFTRKKKDLHIWGSESLTVKYSWK